MGGGQSGKRIGLEETRLSARVVANIDATAIAATQRAPRRKGNAARRLTGVILAKADVDLVLPVFFVAVSVAMADEILGSADFRDPEDLGILSGSGNANGELAPIEILFNQDGLGEPLNQAGGDATEFARIVRFRMSIDPLSGA